ncbi:Rap1-interacting factor 1 N terminal-domain-containing protein [Aspergillus pseudonomiae]|uniref:Rap1-interacting factor 1 N terminal-domain-containing protein n=1 Tax=Aspergillus pseudonomiae TaxID=1506151 RepID=A0A5N6IH87_9EURO|nr:Rap1-interacting factor 1 N terminal-domain-containing protein [Aspergillus pseudonomiae]KAB8265808.1 Rap1-interacting factor 1 N terminal-domain-containing protein [Aspergillus pseudonomiae]KAE8401043.1 Rap1-interacting factor 1 N terminal-domain-containing protein [Aspergillus pseudonomiae]
MVQVLGPLSARPPTPPRTSSRVLPEKDHTQDTPVTVKTTNDSPLPASASNGGLSSRKFKRVNFSPWPKSHPNKPDLKTLPPSNECKPSKSILKTTSSPAPVNSPNVTSYTPESFAMLLESITQQLAGESVSSRLDAYMQFFGALRAYDGLPGGQEIADKLGLITQFIQRDVTRDLGSGGPSDTNLVTQALKLATALVWHTEICAQLPDDFKIFLVDHSINGLQDAKLPKSVATHYMSILSTQTFHAKIMNNSRLNRLMSVLHEITNRVNGNAITLQRLAIYQRILTQNKSLFISQTPLWMNHLISGLLHHIKDVRVKAISLSYQTSLAFGPNPILSKNIRNNLDRPIGQDRKLVQEVSERMSRMMSSADTGVHVPQIWIAVILLLRNKRLTVDHWEHLKEFTTPLQKCFNCSDGQTRAQSIIAWNRFVCVIGPNDATNPAVLKILIRAILSQLERRSQSKLTSQPNQMVLCSYYNLLYYAFRPSASFQHLDVVWEEYLAIPSSTTFSMVPGLSDKLAQVLSNMLWSSQAKVWLENKANESNRLLPEELPALDCRWVRSRITAVLKVFENIFRSSTWSDDIEQSSIAAAWVSLSRALSYASSKEITPSPESMQAVAHMLGLLQRLWKAGPASLNAIEDNSLDMFFDRFRFLSTTMIVSLGSIPFTEKLLLKTADEKFQAANTPTHRSLRINVSLDSPILHLLRLISDVSGVREPTASYLRLINDTLGAACKGRTARSSRLELLRQCADLFPSETEFAYRTHTFAQVGWKSTARLAADSLCSYPIESARERDGSVLRDYDNAIKILSTGLKFSDTIQEWDQLVDSLIRVVRTEKGDDAIATMVVEPISECMMALRVQDTYLPAASLFGYSLSITYCHYNIRNTGVPVSGQDGQASGNSIFPAKLVELVNRILRESYEGFDPTGTNGIADFLESFTSLLSSGVPAFRSAILETTQQPLALWLKDDVRKINVESGVESRIITAGRALSSAVISILQACSPHNASCLQRFEPIICAGLESSHMSIAKRFLDFWNSSFGQQKSLPYPESISRALQQLESQIKLQNSGQGQVERPATSLESQTLNSDRADMSEKSRIAFILDHPVEPSYPVGFNSSPVTRVIEPRVAEQPSEARPRRSAEPNESDQIAVEDASVSFLPPSEEPKKRTDVFSMIENLRSSSPPINTPREYGFMTPPQLRGLRGPDRESGTPQTPTLPAVVADNEDGFLGSSPTPGIRGRTQSVGSQIPSSLSTPAMDSRFDSDVPSSPPELKSQGANARNKQMSLTAAAVENRVSKKKKSKKSKRSALKDKKRPDSQHTQSEDAREDPSRAGTPLSSRLRSSTGKTPQADAQSTIEPQPNIPPVSEPILASNASKSHHGSPDKPMPLKSTPKDVAVSGEITDGLDPACDWIADSFSDDMETQIASQLEQDLEFAVDSDKPDQEQETELPSEPPMTRKRKRDEENASTPSRAERRRSTRSSAKECDADIKEPRRTRSKKSMLSGNAQEVASSPAASAPKKQKLHAKGDADDVPARLPDLQPDSIGSSKGSEASASQKRRSSRLSGNSPLAVPEEGTAPRKSPRNGRSRKRNAKRKGNASREPSPRSEAQAEETATAASHDDHQKETQGSFEQNDIQQPEEPATHTPTAEHTATAPTSEKEPPTDQEPENDTNMGNADGDSIPQTRKRTLSGTTQMDAHQENVSGATGIITSFRNLLDDIKSATLDRDAIRQIDDLMFEIRVETGEALRRHTG